LVLTEKVKELPRHAQVSLNELTTILKQRQL